MKKGLTNQQLKFVEFYAESGNATESAKKAGYSEKTAYSQGSRLLKKDEIKEAIAEVREEIRKSIQENFLTDAIKARKVMEEILEMEDAPPHVKFQVAKDFLDRAGFKPQEKHKHEHDGGMSLEINIKGSQSDEN